MQFLQSFLIINVICYIIFIKMGLVKIEKKVSDKNRKKSSNKTDKQDEK